MLRKKLLCLLVALCMALPLFACAGDEPDETEPDELAAIEAEEPATGAKPAVAEVEADSTDEMEWSVYWYLCGSDLESEGGYATSDLLELCEAELPENVQVVIETGGSTTWESELIDESKLQRFVYNSEGLTLVDEQPSASMGETQTLTEFLTFASTNYPAKKTAVVFWNHGGGSVTGAAFDELYDNDSLRLDEMYEAFSTVYPVSAEDPPIELIGFDTCLMATVDVAYTFSDIARYMVASEETEPANGWYYSQWVGALADDPSMDGAEIGWIICDAFYEGCEIADTQEDITLSLIDLSKTPSHVDAYDAFGAEALAVATENPGFFSQFGRIAARSENYGGNTREQGYTNMVDLGHLARQATDMLETSRRVLAALDDCVLYKVASPYRAEATGLSCYYSYNGDLEDFAGFVNVGAGTAFKYFYSYELTGKLDEAGMQYAESLDIKELPEVVNLTTAGWDDAPLKLDDKGVFRLELGPKANDILAGIGFQLYYVDEKTDTMMLLGTDNDMTADWENGVFYDNFRSVWGAIDGKLVYMELNFAGEDYNLYSVPVLLNGKEYNLQVVYDFKSDTWRILGARQGINEHGMADKELRLLKEGDELTIIWKMASFSGDDRFESYTADTIVVSKKTAFAEALLFDGTYRMVFEMWDAMGNHAYSAPAQFDCADGEIMATVVE